MDWRKHIMNKYKTLYISDLDGTLLNQNAELSAYTKDTLNKMVGEGLYFTVATARTASSAFKSKMEGSPCFIKRCAYLRCGTRSLRTGIVPF